MLVFLLHFFDWLMVFVKLLFFCTYIYGAYACYFKCGLWFLVGSCEPFLLGCWCVEFVCMCVCVSFCFCGVLFLYHFPFLLPSLTDS